MDTIQIVITTILSLGILVAFCSLVRRMAAIYEDHLWIELAVMVTLGLLIYLVAR